MTVFSINKNSEDNKKLQEVFSIVPDLKMYVVRNSKIDGRMGCGLGYNVKLQVFNRTYNTVFNNSQASGCSVPDPEGIIYCILSDADCYNYSRDFRDFCNEFGYEEYKEDRYGNYKENTEAKKAFNACKKSYEAINRLFTGEQLEQLREVFQDY